ncbi:MAG: uncharacterized protein KVP18_004483 [Porospora cf. gigantea A]|uniref:uncharacterized protein n=1 Tax=Porospora cf. gigantea A TaxID=2853593 RepID=UPI00355A6B9C|nr:MAG: hypothetical protein KVP18_004483 [Porospora cf. gigantea A]
MRAKRIRTQPVANVEVTRAELLTRIDDLEAVLARKTVQIAQLAEALNLKSEPSSPAGCLRSPLEDAELVINKVSGERARQAAGMDCGTAVAGAVRKRARAVS